MVHGRLGGRCRPDNDKRVAAYFNIVGLGYQFHFRGTDAKSFIILLFIFTNRYLSRYYELPIANRLGVDFQLQKADAVQIQLNQHETVVPQENLLKVFRHLFIAKNAF